MKLVFYTAAFSSASPVATVLTELEVPHERVLFDLKEQRHKQPEFLKLNPNGKVPTLVVDGTPMFEALAILQWLGDRFGVARGLWPAMEAPARLQALAWTTWGYVSYGAVVARLFMSTSEHVPAELHNAAHAERAKQDLGELLDILEDRLSAQDHLLGKDFSLVDLVVAQVVIYSTMVGADVADRKHVRAWLESIQGRRSFKTEWS